MSDLISRQAAIDASEKFIKDCNPEHFVGHQKFIEYMDNAEIGSFGKWQFANGFNMGLTATEVAIKKLPSAQPAAEPVQHAKWIVKHTFYKNIPVPYNMWSCSFCGHVRKQGWAATQEGQKPAAVFCENCSARMDK